MVSSSEKRPDLYLEQHELSLCFGGQGMDP
jgi:hypothetical protein